MESYIGVTGFMTRGEVNQALATLDNLEREKMRSPHHLLMVGVLASSKTLAGGTNKYPKRYPKVTEIEPIFPPDRRTLNLIHYATDDQETLYEQLCQLVEYSGPYLDGFQLNIAWPNPDTLSHFGAEHDMRIVLQLGSRALELCEHDPKKVVRELKQYDGLISHVLLDMSGGKGVPMDPAKTAEYVDALHSFNESLSGPCPEFGVGIAGGLAGGAFEPIKNLVQKYKGLSIDAEGRLRSSQDDLGYGMVDSYMREANYLFR